MWQNSWLAKTMLLRLLQLKILTPLTISNLHKTKTYRRYTTKIKWIKFSLKPMVNDPSFNVIKCSNLCKWASQQKRRDTNVRYLCTNTPEKLSSSLDGLRLLLLHSNIIMMSYMDIFCFSSDSLTFWEYSFWLATCLTPVCQRIGIVTTCRILITIFPPFSIKFSLTFFIYTNLL